MIDRDRCPEGIEEAARSLEDMWIHEHLMRLRSRRITKNDNTRAGR